ncbi:hypothetical protein EXIGLDRAFT_694490 [Exidia glandulosa HHB12029]|uniref:Uncharacterized protein n=1 Tax=Exidia glandulosa HHB12029 TaxID=1314781 RepID=A0A165GKC9_EXIGL|nr:hypothetical protein EXIGLDRAFT_694490 [Exidia glandulosa HHB12029]
MSASLSPGTAAVGYRIFDWDYLVVIPPSPSLLSILSHPLWACNRRGTNSSFPTLAQDSTRSALINDLSLLQAEHLHIVQVANINSLFIPRACHTPALRGYVGDRSFSMLIIVFQPSVHLVPRYAARVIPQCFCESHTTCFDAMPRRDYLLCHARAAFEVAAASPRYGTCG